MKKLLWQAIFFAIFSEPVFYLQASPLGEKAHYSLDKDASSSILRSGSVTISVTEAFKDETGKSSFKGKADYTLKSWVGSIQGKGELILDELFYSEKFAELIEEEGEIHTEFFKVRYLGKEDVTIRGRKYFDCTLIEIYDLSQPGRVAAEGISDLTVKTTEIKDSEEVQSLLKNFYFTAAIKRSSVAAAGIVTFTVNTEYEGLRVKAKLDYDPKGFKGFEPQLNFLGRSLLRTISHL